MFYLQFSLHKIMSSCSINKIRYNEIHNKICVYPSPLEVINRRRSHDKARKRKNWNKKTSIGQKWTTLKTKVWAMPNSLKWRVNSSAWKDEQFYSTSVTHCDSHVQNPLISNDQGNKDYIVSTTNDGSHLWSSVTQIVLDI